MLMWIVYAVIFAQTALQPLYSICEARICRQSSGRTFSEQAPKTALQYGLSFSWYVVLYVCTHVRPTRRRTSRTRHSTRRCEANHSHSACRYRK